jgi:cyclopropane fatty-acyl-phospholipid synthase-like methyltransferase
MPPHIMPKTKKKKPLLTARNADKHVLYQESVQDTETEALFLTRVFKKLRGRPPESLREDFCGTALLCAEWVKKAERTAVGVDLSASVLAWGTKHHLAKLDEPGNRVTLLKQDVRERVKGSFDVTVALNFSYFVFRTRDELRGYFENARRSMKDDGLFFIDAYGGNESLRVGRESRRQKGFTYIWDQARIDPIDNGVTNHIHFHFRDGSKMEKAFTYVWRLWTLPELCEVLAEAGFSRSTVYWEDADEDGEGTGTFRPRKHVEQEAAWVAYIVAER